MWFGFDLWFLSVKQPKYELCLSFNITSNFMQKPLFYTEIEGK